MIGKHLEHQLLFKNINNNMTKEEIAIYLANNSGTTLIEEERKRQISEEGYDWRHDDEVRQHELSYAASAYLVGVNSFYVTNKVIPPFWPWPSIAYKPAKDQSIDERIKILTKAGALVAAEIDKYQRMKMVALHGEGE